MIEVNLARVKLVQNLDKAQTGYSMFYTTDISNLLDVMFGIEDGLDLTSASADKRIRDAKLFRIGSLETNKVIDYFTDLALSIGYFVALPYNEIPSATDGKITYFDLETTIKEEFLVKRFYPKQQLWLAELSDKFSPLY